MNYDHITKALSRKVCALAFFLTFSINQPSYSIDLTQQYNLSFELDEVGSETTPSRWAFPASETVSLQIIEDSPDPTAGKKCLEVDYSNSVKADWSRVFLSDFIEIDPQRSYDQSVWIRTEGRTANGFGVSVGRQYYDDSQTLIEPLNYSDRYLITNSGNLEWQHYSVELTPSSDDSFNASTIPSNARYVRLLFVSHGYDLKYWIDDLKFEPSRSTGGQSSSVSTRVVKTTVPREAIRLDGRLLESDWQSLDGGDFVRAIVPPTESSRLINQTRFRVLSDANYLYIGGACDSSNPMETKATEHNSLDVFHEECVEILIDASGQRRLPIQIGITPKGTRAELYHGPRKLEIQSATSIFESGWTLEMKISKASIKALLSTESENGEIFNERYWNFNVCRHQPNAPVAERFSSWSYTRSAFSDANAMGLLLFDSEKAILKNKITKVAAALHQKLRDQDAKFSSSPLRTIQAQLEKLQQLGAFVSELESSIASADLSTLTFVRYFNELDLIPTEADSIISKLERLAVAFPSDREAHGYMLFQSPLVSGTGEDIYPDKGAIARHSVRLAMGEVHSSRFSLFAKNRLEGVALECGDLKSENGNVLPAAKLDIRVIQPWGSDHQADILVTDTRIPLEGWLENYSSQPRFISEVAENTSRHLLLKVDASGIEPGIYHGAVWIRPENSQPTELPLSVEVLPFVLPPAERDLGFFYHGVLAQPNGPAIGTAGAVFYNGMTTEESMRCEFNHLVQSGFNFLVIPVYAGGPLNEEYARKVLCIAHEAGLKKVVLSGSEHILTFGIVAKGGDSLVRAQSNLEERLKRLSEVVKEIGLEVYLYGQDEPNNDAEVATNNLIFEIGRKYNFPGMVACIRDDMQARIRNLDTVTMNWIIMSRDASIIDKIMQKRGHSIRSVMYYANLTAHFTPAARMTNGWYLYKSGMNGSVPWGYYFLNKDWIPFADNGKGVAQNSAYYVFPTKDDPIPTLKFEAIREGVNDLRYLEMLTQLISTSAPSPTKKKMEDELGRMLKTFSLENPKASQSDNFRLPPEVYDDYRIKLQDMIIEMKHSR